MTIGFIEQSALRFEGFTDTQIAQITAAIPQMQALVELVQKNEAVITQASMLGKALLPVVDMILTVIKEKKA
jgi:hypothetical protein